MKISNNALWATLMLASAALMGCGGSGGGGSGADSTSGNSSVDWNATPQWNGSGGSGGTGGSGGSGGSGSANNSSGGSDNSTAVVNVAGIPTDPNNTIPLHVDSAMGNVNMPYVSITVCAPGGQGLCATVDRMLVDTGSTGVRIAASALQSVNAALLKQVGAVDDTTASNPIAECMPFASGYMWGSVKRADVTLGNRTAANLPIQVTGDGLYTLPNDCSNYGGIDMSTVQALGANGILGIGHGTADSDDATRSAVPGLYYFCTTKDSCTSTRMTPAKEVANPVAMLATDYNGTVISLPAIPAGGQASATGQLILGIGTQANNQFPAKANYFAVDKYGTLTTQYHGMVLTNSAIDSGTPAYAFPDASIPTSPTTWMTPSSTQSLLATLEAKDGSTGPFTVRFSVANANTLLNGTNWALGNIGAYFPSSRAFLWGLPFFYGRNVYTVIGTNKIGTHTGPLVAF
jgi:hypothetical protein